MKKNCEKLKDKKLQIIMTFSLLYMIMLIFIPRNLDDWAWGTKTGIERLQHGFQGYNGRYLSNIITLIFTRMPAIVFAIIGALIVFTILYQISKLARKSILILVPVMMILLMPRNTFVQTFGWVSGFTNYVISLLMIVTYLLFLRKYYDYKKMSVQMAVFLLVSGIGVQLILENTTIFFVLAGIFCIIWSVHYNKKMNFHYLLLFIGNIIGMLIMFTNSAYLSAAIDNGKTYKKIDIDFDRKSFIQQTWKSFSGKIIKYWFTENIWLIIILGLTMIGFCIVVDLKFKRVLLFIFSAMTAMFFLNSVDADQTFYFPSINSLKAVAIIVFCLAMVAAIVLGIKNSKEKLILLVTLLSQIPLVLPLIVSEPVNARCFMNSYVMFTVFEMQLIYYIVEYTENRLQGDGFCNIKKYICKYSFLVAACFILLRFGMDTNGCIFIKKALSERNNYIEKMAGEGKENLIVPYIPMSGLYCVNMNPKDENWQECYNDYYGFPSDIRYTYINYWEWEK